MDYYISSGPEYIKKERAKARKLKKTRWWLDQVNKGLCQYCQKTFSKEFLSMDHKIPLAKGGKSIKKNIVLSCKSCNTHKKITSTTEILLQQI